MENNNIVVISKKNVVPIKFHLYKAHSLSSIVDGRTHTHTHSHTHKQHNTSFTKLPQHTLSKAPSLGTIHSHKLTMAEIKLKISIAIYHWFWAHTCTVSLSVSSTVGSGVLLPEDRDIVVFPVISSVYEGLGLRKVSVSMLLRSCTASELDYLYGKPSINYFNSDGLRFEFLLPSA